MNSTSTLTELLILIIELIRLLRQDGAGGARCVVLCVLILVSSTFCWVNKYYIDIIFYNRCLLRVKRCCRIESLAQHPGGDSQET